MNDFKPKNVLVTGGNGFIGSHLALRLREQGHHVKIADVNPVPSKNHGCEQIIGNLCDPMFCSQIVRGVDVIFHFAANMGGMGAIHATNGFLIYKENSQMTLSLLEAAVQANVKSFFYASSACVYPDSLQSDTSIDVSLREEDVWSTQPPSPQGLYGLQKLEAENVLYQYRENLQFYIARFHNVYGPFGSWMNGREKAPAALLRKALAMEMLQHRISGDLQMEIWGNGQQRRSFLYIDDCIDAILALWNSSNHNAINIGSETAVSISSLGLAALGAAGIQNVGSDCLAYQVDRPVGVASRNSNNQLAYKVLGNWRPTVTIEEGLARMKPWMEDEILKYLSRYDQSYYEQALRRLCSSNVIDMQSDMVSFAILLPVTSKDSPSLTSLQKTLRIFARSLYQTTYKDTHEMGMPTKFKFKVYVAVDASDRLLNTDEQPVIKLLREENIMDATQYVCNFLPGHVCELWRYIAQRAYEDECTYFVLMGDDVEIHDCNWMSSAHSEFEKFSQARHAPLGFGCVAFTDISFPGMPTFPIVHRTHLDIFKGVAVPHIFINQDGDPYLFQLYRRWGCSVMMEKRLTNAIGGSDDARYTKMPATKWTFDTLSTSVSAVESWLVGQGRLLEKKLILDVVVPSYRVYLPFLDRILALEPSANCSVMFIIIIDDPASTAHAALECKYAHRPDVRIRINKHNMGASFSRNRGLAESAADWVIFVDDDVLPDSDFLVQAERAIREHPNAAGFVGTSVFPLANSVFTASVHLAGVTYFWDIAKKLEGKPAADVPWGVTANLIVRRDYDDEVKFDLSFPKTGGGEDIAFCRNKREKALEQGYTGFHVAPLVKVTHPWWSNGSRSYWRFYMWSKGDGALIKMFPNDTYWDYAPNSAESILFAAILATWAVLFGKTAPEGGQIFVRVAYVALPSIFIANVIHDWYRHLIRDKGRTLDLGITITGLWWLLAVTESTFVRMFSESGRLVGMLERVELNYLGKRFDWFVGQYGEGPKCEERKNSLQRLAMTAVVVALLVQLRM